MCDFGGKGINLNSDLIHTSAEPVFHYCGSLRTNNL